ncbi:hypothetical protein FAY30_19605 [Bacillus sp. S3]|uniref:DUF6044 family protein n=1 Tax=Bacillus sp. S3 TaxID=486398 RepID=UPI00118C78FA|nr:DUF6044 family protein [Bacillus sp. S3]QCJ43930.1 hypothetical protein FAY30_19605 [Bacillus sp. S3]
MVIETKKERRLILFALLVLAIYLSPLFILQENAHIRVHDNLDSNLAWYKVLAKSGEIFGNVNAVIPQIINGQLSRNAFGTEYSLIVWLYALFPTMIAYGLSQALTRVAAFFGMYLLLKDHFLIGDKWLSIRIGSALAFALTPFWPSGMLSTLGMPLALWALLNIRNGERSWKNYLVLTLIPFYASIVLGFFFFLTAIGVVWLWDVLRGKGWNLRFLFAISYMTFIFMLLEYRLVYSFLFSKEPNSRDEYFHAHLSFWRAGRLFVKNYLLGHNHVMTVHTLLIVPATFIAIYFVFSKKLWQQEKLFVFLFGLNIFLSLWYAFWFYEGWLPLTEKFHFMNTFNFARYHFLRPFVIYASFALALKIISQQGMDWTKTAKWMIVLQIVFLGLCNDEIIYQDKPTVKEFFAEDLFHEIKEYIALPQEEYRVASIGIHPAVSQYNGFYTVDTYNNFYPLSYKHQFRKIIEKELAKNKTVRKYFDKWGGRCYIFTAQLGKRYMLKKDSKRHLKNLELNTDVFKEMGGRYIFSAIPIDNAEQNQLLLDKVFVSKTAAWKIYLYKTL